jgi:hypothetical protein
VGKLKDQWKYYKGITFFNIVCCFENYFFKPMKLLDLEFEFAFLVPQFVLRYVGQKSESW